MSDLKTIKAAIKKADETIKEDYDLSLEEIKILYEDNKFSMFDLISDFFQLGFYYGYKQAKEEVHGEQ